MEEKNNMENHIENTRLQEICIENDWFTCGNNSQYEKLFDMNRSGASLDDLATVIWLCSDVTAGCNRSEIFDVLHLETLPMIGISCLVDALRSGHFGEWEIERICLAVSNSSANGKIYRTV